MRTGCRRERSAADRPAEVCGHEQVESGVLPMQALQLFYRLAQPLGGSPCRQCILGHAQVANLACPYLHDTGAASLALDGGTLRTDLCAQAGDSMPGGKAGRGQASTAAQHNRQYAAAAARGQKVWCPQPSGSLATYCHRDEGQHMHRRDPELCEGQANANSWVSVPATSGERACSVQGGHITSHCTHLTECRL